MTGARLFELIERIGTLLRAELRKSAAKVGGQPVHLQVLGYLAQCNRYSNTPAGVTAYLGITKGTASQSLGVLERKGLVNKVPDIKDRRVVHLHLTEQGQRLLQGTWLPALWAGAGLGLEERQWTLTEQALEQILRNVQRRHRYQTFGPCLTCRHLQQESSEQFRCGLTQELLQASETAKICHEHAFPQA